MWQDGNALPREHAYANGRPGPQVHDAAEAKPETTAGRVTPVRIERQRRALVEQGVSGRVLGTAQRRPPQEGRLTDEDVILTVKSNRVELGIVHAHRADGAAYFAAAYAKQQ